MNTPIPSGEVIRLIREQTDTVFLSFSCGKDSLATWLSIRDHFKVIPFYCYRVPGLSFVEKNIRYYERYFGTRIIRVPHPSLYRMLRNSTFQPPERIAMLESCGWAKFGYEQLRDDLAADHDMEPNHWMAVGLRASDNPIRMTMIRKHGPINRKAGKFYPIWDMNKAWLVDLLRSNRVLLPAEYRLFARSFDGINFQFLWSIRERYPEDYQRILEWFPLAKLEIKRYEFAQRQAANTQHPQPAAAPAASRDS